MMTGRQLKAFLRYKLGLSKHLFVHIPKNAGMAVRNSRQMRRRVVVADPHFHVSPDYTRRLHETMDKAGFHHGDQHARLIDIRADLRRNLQAVAVVRNPWRRVMSRFTFQFKYKEREGEAVDYSPAAFEAFLEERHEFGGREFFWHRAIAGWFPQMDYIRDEDGNVPVHLLRQEFLADELNRYFGITDLPVRNKSGRKAPPPEAIYTPETIQIVADWYKDDIEHFGFDFDTPAQRGCHYPLPRE